MHGMYVTCFGHIIEKDCEHFTAYEQMKLRESAIALVNTCTWNDSKVHGCHTLTTYWTMTPH